MHGLGVAVGLCKSTEFTAPVLGMQSNVASKTGFSQCGQ